MLAGTVRNAVNQIQMINKWKSKKNSGNILQHEKKNTEMTPEERMLQHYKEQLEVNRESEEYSRIYNKLMSGQDLTSEELDKLKQKNPKAYLEYKADRMEQEAYERRLRNCKTKEEAERLHVNKMNGKLSELKSVVNNPNISKSEKMRVAQGILGDTTRMIEVYHVFTKSAEFRELPTEKETMKYRRLQPEMQEAESNEFKEESTEHVDIAEEAEKKILEEMFELEEKHFGGERKKTVRIDVSL